MKHKNVFLRDKRWESWFTYNHPTTETCPILNIIENRKKTIEEMVYSDIQYDAFGHKKMFNSKSKHYFTIYDILRNDLTI